MTEDARQKRTRRFLNDYGKNINTVSTDGTRTVQRTPTAGKKPHQRIKEKERKRKDPEHQVLKDN
ncbi:hypothetical protein DPMN_120322 [Dreissena polymorpha]|uniref:Uncharacterized protein n=1 Tax=Dreissena polymorpha TaxID=45954 RepID=A0A9D4JNF7_DREPO|nr:hypothetical protein DPMN_120322 [Dreissena polymorpha]